MSSSEHHWEVGTDIGGTFTDIIAIRRGSAEARIAKVPSRPQAPVQAMLEAIEAVGLRKSEVKRFVHGTTRVTNAIVEGRLPKVALVATEGFADVLEIARYRRRDLYRLDIPPKSPPLVPPERCFGLAERLDHEGRVLKALEESEIERLVAWLKGTGVQSVAVALLHAYAEALAEGEAAVAAVIAKALPLQDGASGAVAEHLAHYLRDSLSLLRTQDFAALRAGEVRFPGPSAG